MPALLLHDHLLRLYFKHLGHIPFCFIASPHISGHIIALGKRLQVTALPTFIHCDLFCKTATSTLCDFIKNFLLLGSGSSL